MLSENVSLRYLGGFTYEERLKGINIYNSSKLSLRGDISIHKYLKGINTKAGNKLFTSVQAM